MFKHGDSVVLKDTFIKIPFSITGVKVSDNNNKIEYDIGTGWISEEKFEKHI